MTDLREALQQAAKAGHLPLPEGAAVRRSASRRRAGRRSAVAAAAAVAVVFLALQFTPMPADRPPTAPATPAPGDPGMFHGFVFPEEEQWTNPQLDVDRPLVMPQPCGGMNLGDATPGRVVFEYLPDGRSQRRAVAGFADDRAATKAMDNLRSAAQRCEGWVTGQAHDLGDYALGLGVRTGSSNDVDMLVVRVGKVVWAGWSEPADPVPPLPHLEELQSAYSMAEPLLRTVADGDHYPKVSVDDLQPGRYDRLAGVRLALEAAKGAEVTDRPAFFYLPCQGALRVSSAPARTALVQPGRGQNGEFDVERMGVSVIALRDRGEVGKAVDEAKELLRTCVGPQRDTEAGPPSFTVSGREQPLGDRAVALTVRTINGSGGADLMIVAVDDLLYLAQTSDHRMPEHALFDAKRLLVEQFAADEPALRIRQATPEPGPTDCATNPEMPACQPGHGIAD